MNTPKSLADPAQMQLRQEALAQPHMAPLCAFVQRLRAIAPSGVPDFDITGNAVPWYIGTDTRVRAPTRADHMKAEAHLRELLSLNFQLRVVVLVGRAAQRCVEVVRNAAPTAAVLSCPHPSPLSLNGRPERREEMLSYLSSVVQMLDRPARL